MEDVRNQQSGNRDKGNANAATDLSGKSINDGGSIRTDAREQRQVTNGIGDRQSGAQPSNDDVIRSIGRDSGVEISDGYYFTPNGNVERIPNGYFINSKGQLAKRRRQRNVGSNAVGRTESGFGNNGNADTGETEFVSEDILLDKPLSVRGKARRKTSKVKEETQKLTMVTMIATGCTAIFSSISLLTGHKHWRLVVEEAQHLAEALNDAISTLPSKHYEFIIGIVEKWIPWINLAFVVGAIIIPRIEESAKQVERLRYKPRNTSDTRHTGESNNFVSDEASLGFNS